MAKRRGPPAGNQNAFKHGFYSAAFLQAEHQALISTSPDELANEIDLVRVSIARCLEALQSSPADRDIETELSILRAMNLGALSINSLVRTRMMLARGGVVPPDFERPELKEMTADYSRGPLLPGE